jgi:O-acetyl-ADP-ribose deacetylase (regulator of RNase III)
MKKENVNVKTGNLIDFIKNREANAFLHIANCFHTMGGGIAKQLKENFPNVYKADLKTVFGDYNKMGTISFAGLSGPYIIFNMYAQYHYGSYKKQLNEDALICCLDKVKYYVNKDKTIAYPYMMGCGLAGGDWEVVSKILAEKLDGYNHFAVRLPEL